MLYNHTHAPVMQNRAHCHTSMRRTDRDRQPDRDRHRDRDSQTDRLTDRQTGREREEREREIAPINDWGGLVAEGRQTPLMPGKQRERERDTISKYSLCSLHRRNPEKCHPSVMFAPSRCHALQHLILMRCLSVNGTSQTKS